MSNLSTELPEGAGTTSKQITITATGSLPSGAAVVVRSDGTGEIVSGSAASSSLASQGVTNLPGNPNSVTSDLKFDPNNMSRFVVIYKDASNNNYRTACIGTITGTTISFGTQSVFHSGTGNHGQCGWCGANNIMIEYNASINQSGYVIAATVSGTTMTWGSAVSYQGSWNYYGTGDAHPSLGGGIIGWTPGSEASFYKVVTVSGNTCTLGTTTTNYGASTYSNYCRIDPNDSTKGVIYYLYASASTHWLKPISIGSTVTYGSATSIPVSYHQFRPCPSVTGKFASGSSDCTSIRVGTRSGTSLTLGSVTNLTTDAGTIPATIATGSTVLDDGGTNIFCIWLGTNAILYANEGSVSGNTITWDSTTSYALTTAIVSGFRVEPTSTDDTVVIHYNRTDSTLANVVVYSKAASTNLEANNFIGNSTGAYTNGESAVIMATGGVASGHTGLTPGTVYYVQTDGTLGTSAGTPSVKYGVALSTTQVLLAGGA